MNSSKTGHCLPTQNEDCPNYRIAFSPRGCVASSELCGACLRPKHSGAYLWRLALTFKPTANVSLAVGLRNTFSRRDMLGIP